MRTSPHLPRAVVLLLTGLVAAVLLTGCGSSTPSKPAVCADVDALKQTAQSIKDTSISQGALSEIATKLDTMKAQLATFKSHAKSQYASEIDQLSTGLGTLRTTVDTAKADPTVSTLAPVATALRTVVDSAKSLRTAVEKTC